jgi:hypothetical protein
LEKCLSRYSAAATAAGVSLLALTNAAQAKIVYTPANTPITLNGGPVTIDLNHDGVADFYLSFWRFSAGSGSGYAFLLAGGENQSNQVWGVGSFGHAGIPGRQAKTAKPLKFWSQGNFFVSALRPGFKVGPNKSYFRAGPGAMAAGEWSARRSSTTTGGQWWCGQPRYLGLKVVIKGETHYGWAREQLKESGFTLTGYAYETVPNKPIVTGKTKGPDVIAPEDASLGCLAQGASAISAWRPNVQPTGR